MKRFWQRHDELHGIEDRLRSSRPQAGSELLAQITARLQQAQPRRGRPTLRSRAALALAVTVMLLVAVAALGGMSYAASAGSSSFHSFSRVFFSHSKQAASHRSFRFHGSNGNHGNHGGYGGPAHHQYVTFVYVCLRSHSFFRVTLYLPQQAAYQLESRGIADPGACSHYRFKFR